MTTKKVPEKPQKLLLSAVQAAKRLGVSSNKINMLRIEHGLPHIVFQKRILYPMAGLDAWVQKMTKVVTKPQE